MSLSIPPKNLPILLGALRQDEAEGELVLEQNDGVRCLYLIRGELVHLKSDAAGEQFGNYLLRQGILDFRALSELLANDERYRLGEKVIQWGMMTLAERDGHLQTLQQQILIHALEHPILAWTWNTGPCEGKLALDLHFKLDHSRFIWTTFQESNYLTDLLMLLETQTAWRWEGPPDLLGSLRDLPLTPGTAYALSFLGADPIGFDTFRALSHLESEEAGRFIAILWALGALRLTEGDRPSVLALTPGPEPLTPAPEPQALPLPPVPPPMAPTTLHPLVWSVQPPEPPSGRSLLPPLEWQTPIEAKLAFSPPEFLDPEPETSAPPVLPASAPAPPPLEGPARARQLVAKARHLAEQDRTVEAIRTLEQAVQLEAGADTAFEAWLTLGRLRMANPAWSTRSIEALQNAARIRPAAAEPWATMGEVYLKKGFQTNALACLRKALELDPSVPLPPGVDLQTLDPTPEPQPAPGLLDRFRSILGRSDKP